MYRRYKSRWFTRLSVQGAPVVLRAVWTSCAHSCPTTQMAAGSGTGCTPDREEQMPDRCGSGYPPGWNAACHPSSLLWTEWSVLLAASREPGRIIKKISISFKRLQYKYLICKSMLDTYWVNIQDRTQRLVRLLTWDIPLLEIAFSDWRMRLTAMLFSLSICESDKGWTTSASRKTFFRPLLPGALMAKKITMELLKKKKKEDHITSSVF